MRCTIAHVPVIAQQMFEDAQQKRYFFFLLFNLKYLKYGIKIHNGLLRKNS